MIPTAHFLAGNSVNLIGLFSRHLNHPEILSVGPFGWIHQTVRPQPNCARGQSGAPIAVRFHSSSNDKYINCPERSINSTTGSLFFFPSNQAFSSSRVLA